MPRAPASRLLHPFAALALLLALAPVPEALGWGREGHRIIGLLAESGLSPAARAEVRRLLAGEPEPSLAGVSTWADEVRERPEWRHTTPWHWVNLPRANPCGFVPARDCPEGNCIVGAIRAQFEVLGDRRRPDAERRVALKFLVHFVGDLHQPFHAGFGFDRGGNTHQLRFDRQGWNLHALWDSAMVQHAGLAPEAYARQLRGGPALPTDATLAMARPEERWAVESCQAIHDAALYPQGRSVGRGYLERHRPLAETRLRQAGARLAAMIDDALAARD